MKLTKELISQAYHKVLDQDIREQDSKVITSFAEALFDEFKTLSIKETVNNSLVEMIHAYIDSIKDYKNDSVILPENTFDRLGILLHNLGLPLPENVKRQTTLKDPITLKCDLCTYVGIETNPVGECPKCNFDELLPVDENKQAKDEMLEYQKCGSKQTAGNCTLAGPGRGDCAHQIGLPGVSIPGQHDGSDDTVDAYGKPNGWCWQCWKSKQIAMLQEQIAASNVTFEAKKYSPEVLQSIELYRMQMAGISTASSGHWKEGDSAHPDYITPALIDVAKLYAKYDELYKLCEKHNLVGCQSGKVKNNNWKEIENLKYNNQSELPLTITEEYLDEICGDPEKAHYTVFPNTFHTVCCIKLPNGSTVLGESVCAASKIFNEKLGREYAFKNAREKVWQLEGYSLCDKRYQAGLAK